MNATWLPKRGRRAALLPLALTTSLLAQAQFAESVKTYVPATRDNSRAVRAVDVDGDGDKDLLVGNGPIITGAQNKLLLNDGSGRFVDATATHLPAGLWNTLGLAVGDVDGDGDQDFVTGDSWQNRLFLNDGTGRFADATFGRMPRQASETRDLALVDLDGDGDLDLVCANYRQEAVYLNDGAGRFTDVTSTHMPPDSESTWNLAAADVDGDGDIDLAFANYGLRRLYLNDGSAHFTDVTATRLPGQQANSSSVTFGDVDGDGDRDLLVGFSDTPAVLYLNNGAGTFADGTAGRLSASGSYHWRCALGDVDGDNDLDLIYTTTDEDLLFSNDGTGVFTDVSAVRLPQVHSLTIDAVLADLDGDGDLDLVTADTGQTNRLFFNDGSGTFADATPQQLDAPWVAMVALALGDLDGDGDLDLVSASGDYGETVEADGVHLNDGRGNFRQAPASYMPTPLDDSHAVALGDVDGDGDLDVVFGNLRQQNRLLLNDGSARFTDATATRLPAVLDATKAVALGDVDGDSDLDLVVGNLGERCGLFLNNGAGTFIDATFTNMPSVVFETRALALGDVDGDGDLDIVLGNGQTRNEEVGLFLNDSAGTFTDVTQTNMPASWVFPTASIALGDVDGDGDLDIAVGNDEVGLGRFNRLYVNDGSGHFTDRDLVYDYFRTFAIAFADVDGDGDLDVLCGDNDHRDKLYLNDGNGNFRDVSWPRMPATYDRSRAFALGDVDSDGDVDLVRGSDWLQSTLLVNHHRQVSSPRLAKIGAVWPIEVFAKPGYATAMQTAVPFLASAPASIVLPPWGTLGLDPTTLVILPTMPLLPPAGTVTLPLPIPNAAALVGLSLFIQALVVHDASEARLTNVLAERIVR